MITPQAIRAKEDNEGAKLMDFDGEISLLEQSVAEIIPIMDFNEACFTPI